MTPTELSIAFFLQANGLREKFDEVMEQLDRRTIRLPDGNWRRLLKEVVFYRDLKTGKAKFGYQKTPHDEWDYAGVNYMGLSEQDGVVASFNPPPITGMSTTGGFEAFLQNRAGASVPEMAAKVQAFLAAAQAACCRPEDRKIVVEGRAVSPGQTVAVGQPVRPPPVAGERGRAAARPRAASGCNR